MAKVIKDKRDGHIFAYDPKLLEKDYMARPKEDLCCL